MPFTIFEWNWNGRHAREWFSKETNFEIQRNPRFPQPALVHLQGLNNWTGSDGDDVWITNVFNNNLLYQVKTRQC